MTHPSKQKDRLEMIEAALETMAPQTYRQLKRAGTLQRFVEEREREMMESYDLAAGEVLDRWMEANEPDTLAHLRNLETKTREVWEQTLATWLEFADPPPPTTESERES